MTQHDEGRLMAYVDDQLAARERAELERHLEACEACRLRLEELDDARERVGAALRSIDVAPPTLRARARVARASRGTRFSARHLRRAAAAALLIAGAASAAVPGSPLRRWLAPEEESSEPAQPVAGPQMSESGARVGPADGRIEVRLVGLPESVEILVDLVEGTRAAVFAPPGSSFTTGPGGSGQLTAEVSTGPVRVELPTGAARVSLHADGRMIVRMESGTARWTEVPDSLGDDQFRIGTR